MPRSLRFAQQQKAQMRQRTSQPFVHIESPVGGWNTRDSVDNIAPTEAIILDNWWPDIGEVRTRPGYNVHCNLANATTGSDLVANGGFETAGGGGADVFASWTEDTKDGIVADETTKIHAGSHACKLTISDSLGNATIEQTITVTAETPYTLTFYDIAYDPSFENTTSVNYSIEDNNGGTGDIVSLTETGHYRRTENPSGDYEETVVSFETPAGCTEIVVTLKDGGDRFFTSYYIDAVTLFEIVAAPTHVETLAEYISGANRDLIAISGGEAFKVNTSTPSHLTGSVATMTNSRFQWANFNGLLAMVNGAENMQWDGTTFQSFSDAGVAFTGDIDTDGIDPIGCTPYKNRMWYWGANSQDVYYTDTLYAHGGATTKFPLSRVGQFGGNLVLMESWTRDGGSGPDDFAVFVMSSGEAIVYQGSYPGASGDWALVGIYNIGEPLGYRSAVKFGGDLYIITKLDTVRMSEVIMGMEARQMESKIVQSHRTAVSLYGDNWGWEATVYPSGHMAIFNIPVTENPSDSDEDTNQHVQNTITGAWARFKGLQANTWQLYDGGLYIGSSDGKILQFDSGEIDNVDEIQSTFQTAWLPLGGLGANKLFKAVREAYKANADVTVSNFFATDFRGFAPQPFPVAVSSASAEWDVAPWDTSFWTANDTIYHEWHSIGAFGERISMQKRLSTKQRVTHLGSSWLIETGARL